MAFYGTIGEVDLSALDQSTIDNARDIFVYDTSKDSDGGKWRKRTKKTSWYNEPLNTATRGSRREFPAVAVIVASAAPSRNLYIYDGDDPDLPMWMVVDSDDGQWPLTETSSLYAVNGIIALGSYSSTQPVYATRNRLDLFHFISDKIEGSTNIVQYAGIIEGIANRRSIAVINQHIGTNPYSLVNYNIRSVAMTVLPSAPIDNATGLPVPTIIVCTGGGTGGAASIIKDDRTVSNITNNIYGSGYQFSSSVFDNGEYFTACASGDYTRVGIANISTATHKYFITSPNIPGSYKVNLGYAWKSSSLDEGLAIGGIYGAGLYRESGLCLIKPDMNNFSAGTMHSHITSTYNTGYQVGDIKGAFLSDTDATNVTGSELITNGDFSSALGSEWQAYDTNGSVHTFSIVSGELEVVRGNAGVGNGEPYQAFSTVVGKTYTLTIRTTSGDMAYQCGTVVGGTQYFNITTSVAGTTYSRTFTATSTTGYIEIIPNNANTTARTDNISLRIAELDRSINNKGLQVFGTVTKSAVANNADLVRYSGFSSSNYLFQPYNSDLDFGTGDFCYMCWVKDDSVSSGAVIFQRGSAVNSNETVFYIDNGFRLIGRVQTTTSAATTATNTFIEGEWNHCVFLRSSGTSKIYHNGIEVASTSNTQTANQSGQGLSIGAWLTNNNYFVTSISLFRVSASVPSAEQIKKIYEDEKVLFQENAKCTLYGSSDVVTALAYDDSNDTLHAGTSSGRSDFRGLTRINNTTTGVTTAISASNKLIAEQ